MSEEGNKDGNQSEKEGRGQFPTLSRIDSVEAIGSQIGPYKLLSVLGEGGFGIVYRAEQKEPVRRQVALKVIKPGMDSKQVIARFEAERQALALLDHPNIAHVFDGGTTESSRPYFVMEYVRGVPITEYCDRNKLDTEERLQLFIQVCEAIQHAHQKGIIHRDVKPSNILVSVQEDKAIPKIIDFGVAKAISHPLTERTFFTEQGQFIGTPEYMSPEQTGMTIQDVDTRSDIYSLGVVLYELLTGTLPFDPDTLRAAAFDEVIRIIRDADPPCPSTRLLSLGEKAMTAAANRRTDVRALSKRLHKELEWIPLKAMRKEPSRRYRTASELADDIRNYLDGDPLIAGPESVVYRAKKFARKHSAPIESAVAIFVVLLVALVISTMMYFRAEQQAEDYRRSLYVNRINLAEKYYRESHISRVRELLTDCPNDLRKWEWYYLWGVSDQARVILRGHNGSVPSVAFSPDGKQIVSGSEDNTIRVWDANKGAELMTLRGHRGSVRSVALSPDGKWIVSGSEDNTIRVWDANKGVELMTLWGHRGSVRSVALSPDGKWIVSGSEDRTVKVWDGRGGAEVMTLRGHNAVVNSVAFSPDGKWIVSGSEDRTVKVWDGHGGAEVMTLRGPESGVSSVAFSPDGRRIVSSDSDGVLKVWGVDTGAEVMTLRGHNGYVSTVAFSPDSRRIVSSSWDGTLRIWDADSGREVRALQGHAGYVLSAAFSPDGTRIVSGGYDGMLNVWYAESGAEVMMRQEVYSVAFRPDGKRLVVSCGNNTPKVLDAASGTEVMTLRGGAGYILSVEYSPDGERIVSSSWDGTLKIWDADSGREVRALQGHAGDVLSAAFSPDGRRIVSGSEDKTLKVWDANSGSALMTLPGHKGDVYSVAFSPDGRRIVSGSGDNTLKIWDADSGSEVRTLQGHKGYVSEVAFSPDGRWIVSSSWDGTLGVWDADSGSESKALRGHAGYVLSVAFSPDGKRIASGSSDKMLKVWVAVGLEEVAGKEDVKLTRKAEQNGTR